MQTWLHFRHLLRRRELAQVVATSPAAKVRPLPVAASSKRGPRGRVNLARDGLTPVGPISAESRTQTVECAGTGLCRDRATTARRRASRPRCFRGQCSFPGYNSAIMRFVRGEPYIDYQIADIRDSRPGNTCALKSSIQRRRSRATSSRACATSGQESARS